MSFVQAVRAGKEVKRPSWQPPLGRSLKQSDAWALPEHVLGMVAVGTLDPKELLANDWESR